MLAAKSRDDVLVCALLPIKIWSISSMGETRRRLQDICCTVSHRYISADTLSSIISQPFLYGKLRTQCPWDRSVIGRQSRGGSQTLFLCTYFSLSLYSVRLSMCWITMYHCFRSNGCLAAGSGCCRDGWEDIMVCVLRNVAGLKLHVLRCLLLLLVAIKEPFSSP